MDLSIIIPAYKADYIDQTFESIKKQTNCSYTLYVFDDASPYPIKEHFDKYFANQKNCFYHRYDNNLGGKNLAQHWERCIRDSGHEPWFWLFSDDDIMDKKCVETILKAIKNVQGDVLRTNLYSFKDEEMKAPKKALFEDNINAFDFFEKLYTKKLDARMPEFIFRREKFEKIGGYIKFDLAWRSDNASVMAMTYPFSITTLHEANVYWRYSNVNISKNKDEAILRRKNNSTIEFFNWVDNFYKVNGRTYRIKDFKLMKVYSYWMEYSCQSFSFSKRFSDLVKIQNTQGFRKKKYLKFWIFICYLKYIKFLLMTPL